MHEEPEYFGFCALFSYQGQDGISQVYFWTSIWVTLLSVQTSGQICMTYLACQNNHNVQHIKRSVFKNLLHCLELGSKSRVDKYYQNSDVPSLTSEDDGSLN